jgi:hypothetical protein
MAVTFVGRVERPTEQADSHASAVAKARYRVDVERLAGPIGQGRTCPVPMT